jgi:hypothetical protein
MEYSKKTRDAIAKILKEEEEYPFKTLKNLDLKNFPKGETVFPHQCGHCGVGMGEGYYTGDGYACSQHCMLSILYSQDAYYWTTWQDVAQENIRDGEPVYDTEGNAYYVTEEFEKKNVHLNEPSFVGGHHYDYY